MTTGKSFREKYQDLIKAQSTETRNNKEIAARLVAFEILLTRIKKTSPEIFSRFGFTLALKGGYALLKRSRLVARLTKDQAVLDTFVIL
jgi:hypothetical protein